MNQKPRPDSNLADITPEQADQLFELLRSTPYYAAVKWVDEQWGLAVSVSGLRRWWSRETRMRARADLRNAIKASEQFDKDLDSKALDERATHAIRAAFWQAITSGDLRSVQALGGLVLDYNADARGGDALDLKRKALDVKERKLDLDREKFEAAEARLSKAREVVSDTKLTDAERTERMKEIFGL